MFIHLPEKISDLFYLSDVLTDDFNDELFIDKSDRRVQIKNTKEGND